MNYSRLQAWLTALIWALITIAWAAIWIIPHYARADAKLAVLDDGCKPRDEMTTALYRRFEETKRGAGTSKKGSVELYHAPGGRTFTVLQVTADGTACILAFGENWLRR